MGIKASGDLAYNNLSIPLVYNNNFLNVVVEEQLVKVGNMCGKFYNSRTGSNTISLVRYEAAQGKYVTVDLIDTPTRFSPVTGYMCFQSLNMSDAYRKSAFDLVNDNLSTHFYGQTKTINSSGDISFKGLNPSVYLHDGGVLHFTTAKAILRNTTTYGSRVGSYTAQLGNNPPITGYTTAQSAHIDFLSADNANSWFSAQKMRVTFTADAGYTTTSTQTYAIDADHYTVYTHDHNYWVADFYNYQ